MEEEWVSAPGRQSNVPVSAAREEPPRVGSKGLAVSVLGARADRL